MKKTWLKITVLLTLAAVLLASFSCCGTTPVREEQTTAAEVTTGEQTPGIELNVKWKVVRPDETDKTEVYALQLICRAFRSVYGGSFEAKTDFLKPEAGLVESEYEILVGPTNRQLSQDAYAELEGTEGVWRVVSDKRIVVVGGSPDATYAAAAAFVKELFGYEEELDFTTGKYTVKNPGTAGNASVGLEAKVDVPFPTIILNGTDLCEYSVVCASSVKKAENFANLIVNLCGHKPEIISEADYKEGPAFFLGYTPGCEGGHVFETADTYSFYITSKEGFVALDWEGKTAEQNVYTAFVENYLPDVSQGTVKTELPEGTTCAFTVDEYNHLQLSEEKSESLATGVTYVRRDYTDGDGAPVVVHAVVVEKGAATFYTGLPGDAAAETAGNTSTVMNTIKAAEANGKKVLAGINTGFFDLGGTGLSRGLVVKEGKQVSENDTSRPFFGVLKNGEVGIYAATAYDTAGASNPDALVNQLQTAVAGNIILLKGGKINDIAKGTSMAVTRHPRTAIGIRKDGTVVLIEVDGRQEKLSNGATYLDLIQIFRELGCTDALNVDGGGSSTFIISKNGTQTLMNSPSDGAMRKVQDCLLVLAK